MEGNFFDVVVSIDFGSSGMGYAYSFNDPKNIILGKLNNAGADIKVPSEIVLGERNEVLAYGPGCKTYLSQKGPDSGHYFTKIKMNLYNKNKTIKAENTGKELNLYQVIYRVLSALKDEAIKAIHSSRPDLEEKAIKWVLTIPAIWDEKDKLLMLDAAFKAGLIENETDKSCFFALEPEAASLYCLNDGAIDSNFMVQGKKYIICDLGGGTADIVAHIIGDDTDKTFEKFKDLEKTMVLRIGGKNCVKEIAQSTGGDFGSNQIDKYIFENIISKIFGVKNYQELVKLNKDKEEPYDENELYNEWTVLENQIKTFKESLNEKTLNESYQISFKTFKDLVDENDFKKSVEIFNSKAREGSKLIIKSPKSMTLKFPYQIVYDIMNQQSEKICVEINKIRNNEKDVKDIIFVGGYCSCEIIVKLIKEKLEGFNFYKPSNPDLAVLKGAVIFGIDPYVIKMRKARFTIGQAVNNLWDETNHKDKGKKIYSKEENKYYCEDCFDVFLKINDDIFSNQTIIKEYSMMDSKSCSLRFYKTLKKNPKYIYEEGIEEVGKCTLDAGKEYPLGERDIKVTMKIGGTFFDIKGVHIKSGRDVSVKFETDY